MSPTKRVQLNEKFKGLIAQSISAGLNEEEVDHRRNQVASNKGLSDVFTAFWITVYPYTRNKILLKQG